MLSFNTRIWTWPTKRAARWTAVSSAKLIVKSDTVCKKTKKSCRSMHCSCLKFISLFPKLREKKHPNSLFSSLFFCLTYINLIILEILIITLLFGIFNAFAFEKRLYPIYVEDMYIWDLFSLSYHDDFKFMPKCISSNYDEVIAHISMFGSMHPFSLSPEGKLRVRVAIFAN